MLVSELSPSAGENDAPEANAPVGVGPWLGDWPDDPRYDPDLLRHGDARNVVDAYRYWTVDAVRADLDTRRIGLHVAIENTGHDFNFGSIIRTANNFNVAAVHVIGRRRFNRRGAMVTDRYMHLRYHPDATAFLTAMRELDVTPIAVDNLPGATALHRTELPNPACLVIGAEGSGITDELWQACSVRVEIPGAGSTRSINMGAAAAIVMHHWCVQHHALGT